MAPKGDGWASKVEIIVKSEREDYASNSCGARMLPRRVLGRDRQSPAVLIDYVSFVI